MSSFDKFQSIRILVVDDEPTIRHLLKRWIARSTKADVVEAENGLQGIEMLSSGKIDLVVLDLNMPVLDGIEMLSLIRDDPAYADLEVMVASAVGSEAKIRAVISLGVSDYLLKPLQHDHVIARLEAAFERIKEKRRQKSDQGELSRTRILLADTDANFLDFASAALAAQFTTEAVKTTGEVLVKMMCFKPDAILISPKMTRGRLSFLLEKIDDLAKKRKVAIYTLVDSPADEVEEARISGAITRTFVPHAFTSAVIGLLGGGPAPERGILSWISSIEPEIGTALRQALGMMTGSEPATLEAAPSDPGFDLFGVITLDSAKNDFALAVEVHCQKTFARSLARLMLGCTEEEIDEKSQNKGLEEILNVVAGRIKNSCQERKIEVVLGPPTISAEVPARPPNILHEKQLLFSWGREHTFQLTFLGSTLQPPANAVAAAEPAAAPAVEPAGTPESPSADTEPATAAPDTQTGEQDPGDPPDASVAPPPGDAANHSSPQAGETADATKQDS
jgi:two-component system chemotaxis response regulator CheY